MFSIGGQANIIKASKKLVVGAGVFTATTIFGVVFSAVTFGTIPPANALPSFARQTGQPCGTCHTDYPGLTPYGRLFKLGGYTAGGGKYRSTLFPSQNDSTNALAAYAKKSGSEMPTKAPSDTSKNSRPSLCAANFDDGDRRLHAYASFDQDPTGSPYKCKRQCRRCAGQLVLWRRDHRSHRCLCAVDV